MHAAHEADGKNAYSYDRCWNYGRVIVFYFCEILAGAVCGDSGFPTSLDGFADDTGGAWPWGDP